MGDDDDRRVELLRQQCCTILPYSSLKVLRVQ
jgi:hypothetical protein